MHQPCPFCGGKAKCEIDVTLDLNHKRFFAKVFCRDCNAQAGFACEADHEDALRLAWEHWDRRVTQ